jgi:carboxyl-terminal processing protease
LQNFIDVYQIIKNNYVEPVNSKELIYNAMKGMANNLDPHSQFLNKEERDSLFDNINGEFAGIGIEYLKVENTLKVISPLEGTPAYKAGIKSGDVIFKINNKNIGSFRSIEMATQELKGKVGEKVTLTLLRDKKELSFEIKKDIIKITSTASKIISNDFVYVRVSAFQKNTALDVQTEISKIIENKEIKGIIIDLRGNPGGLLDEAISMADLFLDESVVVFTKDRTEIKKYYNARDGQIIKELPMVVLIDGGSASASEIVAGALQDHKRAIIIGSKSFGKGSVQNIIEFNDGNAIKLTTSRYYTPNGRSIQAKGIVPDVEIDAISVINNKPVKRVSESDLIGHISNDTTDNDPKTPKSKVLTMIDPTKDYYLYEAINTLKIMSLSKK